MRLSQKHYYHVVLIIFITIPALSQSTISLNVDNAPLYTIIRDIEAQTSYNFIYNNDEIDEYQNYSIAVSEAEIAIVLSNLFDDTTIRYQLKNKRIVLSNKNRSAPSTGNIKHSINGIIKNAITGETLIGASILVKGKNSGAVSNEYGYYSLTLPQKKYVLQFSHIGFDLLEIEIDLTEALTLDIELYPEVNTLDEIVIISSKNNEQKNQNFLGVTNLKREAIKKLPSLLGEADVTRVFLTQPGLNTVGEGASGFNVRGGNIDQNLILLDEAPIYNSSHIFGFFSIFNTDAIKDIKLYKEGIPSRYGGRASSVVDVRLREGSTKVWQVEGGIGMLFSRLTIEGPLKKDKISFLASGRKSYFGLLLPLLSNEDFKNSKLDFDDLSVKLNWSINNKNKIYVSGYFGSDIMELNYETFFDPLDPTNQEEEERVGLKWRNTTGTIRWNNIISNNLFMNISGIYSKYNYELSSQNILGGSFLNSLGSNYDWKSSIENWIIKPDFTWYQNTNTTIRFGAHNTYHKFTPGNVEVHEEGKNNFSLNIERGLEIAPYFEYEKKWKHLLLNAGLRYSWFANLGPNSVPNYASDLPKTENSITETITYAKGKVIKNYAGLEPRVSLKYDFTKRHTLKIGYNRLLQYLHLISNTTATLPYDIWRPSGKHIEPLIVNQFSTGYKFTTNNKAFDFLIESYYKTFNNLLEYKNGADLFVNNNLETQLLPAKGFAYGTEFSIYKNQGKLTGNINYTYSVAKRKTTSPFSSENLNNSTYYPSNYDKPHIINTTTSYKLGKKWDVTLFFTYQTGRPITVPTGKIFVGNIPFLTYSNRNQHRLPETHRMDLSFSYTPNRKDKKWQNSWSFGIYNIYGRKNTFSQYNSFNDGEFKTFRFSTIGAPIPFFTYNFKF